MLSLFFIHITVTVVCTITGIFLYSIFKIDRNRPYIFYPILGLVTISLVSQIVALIAPVNVFTFLGFIGVLLLGSLTRRKSIFRTMQGFIYSINQYHSLTLLLFFSVWLMLLVIGSGPTMMDDTESYHIQMIKWLHDYGTVPGLANLHERYGFNSSWFASTSFFLPSSSSTNFYTAFNSVISLWFSGYLITRLPLTRRQQEPINSLSFHTGILFVFLISLLCWPLVRGNAATANYDFITAFFIFVLFVESKISCTTPGSHPFREEWIIWPVYLFTVRIINYPLLLLSLYSLWLLYKEKRWQKILVLTCLAFALLVPFISRNVVLSGYAFYPAKQLDFFEVDWKVEEQTLDSLLYFIKYFNRVNTMFMDIGETEKLSFPSWILAWFNYLFVYDKIIFVLGLSGLLLFFVRNVPSLKSAAFFFAVVMVLQLISWFLLAPDPRFVYGCLLIGAYLLMAEIIRNKMYIRNSVWRYAVAVPLALLIICYTMLKLIRHTDYQNFILPYELPQPAIHKVTVDGIPLSIPNRVGSNWNPRCYATALPCLYIVHPKLRARGASVRDGFRIEK